MRFACEKFAIPMVGGHANQSSPYPALAVAVLGVLDGPALSARAARAGDSLWLLVNAQGAFYRQYPFWDAATAAPAELLRAHLALLPALARAGLVHAAKDVSMGGLAGTAVMFAEAADLALRLDLAAIPRPPGVGEEAWLCCFPSFGFLLAVSPERVDALRAQLGPYPELLAAPIGRFEAGPAEVLLEREGERRLLWDGREALTGF
jgi:selenophosphate synthetase-related protein